LKASNPRSSPSQVGDVLALCSLAIDVERINGAELRELFYDMGCSFLELSLIGRLPPIIKVSFFIELAPLVIEAVCYFMADGGGCRVSVGEGVIELFVFFAGTMNMPAGRTISLLLGL